MQSFTVIVGALLAIFGTITQVNAMAVDYAVGQNMTWVGLSKGVNITLYGNAVEIQDQLQALDPDWVPANSSMKLDVVKAAEDGSASVSFTRS